MFITVAPTGRIQSHVRSQNEWLLGIVLDSFFFFFSCPPSLYYSTRFLFFFKHITIRMKSLKIEEDGSRESSWRRRRRRRREDALASAARLVMYVGLEGGFDSMGSVIKSLECGGSREPTGPREQQEKEREKEKESKSKHQNRQRHNIAYHRSTTSRIWCTILVRRNKSPRAPHNNKNDGSGTRTRYFFRLITGIGQQKSIFLFVSNVKKKKTTKDDQC